MNMTTNGPANLKDAMQSGEKARWEAAIREEIENLEAHGTWKLVEPREVKEGHIPITTRMTLVKKHDGNGVLTRYKGRLIALGLSSDPVSTSMIHMPPYLSTGSQARIVLWRC
jgi:hypothetical protein